MKYQEVELSKFVEVQHAFYLKMAKKTKLEKIIGLNEFKVEKKLFIHNRFLKKVKKLVK